MTKITDGIKVMEITMRQYKGDGATWTPDWSCDFIGNSGEAEYDRDINMWIVDSVDGWEDAALEANEADVLDGYEPVTLCESYYIASSQSTDTELLWAYKRQETYDIDAGDGSICLEMLRRMDLMDEYNASDSESFEAVIQMAADMLEQLVEG